MVVQCGDYFIAGAFANKYSHATKNTLNMNGCCELFKNEFNIIMLHDLPLLLV